MHKGLKTAGLLASAAVLLSVCLSAAAAGSDNNSGLRSAVDGENGCYNVRNSSLFDPTNVAPAINDMVSKMKRGDKLYLQPGNYGFKETIKIAKDTDRLDNCSIVLEGTYTMNGNFDAMLIDGDYLNVEIGTVTSGRATDEYKTQGALPGGIKIRESNYSDFTFGTISGFDYGLRFAPVKEKTGECYNKFRFENINHCYAGLNLNTEATAQSKNPPWVNENAFYGGKISNVYYGILAKKGSYQIDEYNNNSYWNIQFDTVEKDAIFSEFSSYNSFVKPTFNNVNGFYINQKANSKANKFYIDGKLPISKLALYAKGDIIKADLTDADGNVVASDLTTTNIKSAPSASKGFTIKNEQTITANAGTTNIPMNAKTVNVSSASGEVVLKLDKFAEYENSNFILNVTSYSKPISVANYVDVNVITGKITSAGKYKIVYMGGSWRAVKLS